MIKVCFGLCLTIAVVNAGTSYQYVRFLNDNTQRPPPQNSEKARSARSYGFHPILDYSSDIEQLWPETVFFAPGNSIFDVNLGGFEHPPFPQIYDNGIESHDPYLLTGHAAHQAVQHLYGKGELFFTDIPHIRQILKLQHRRKSLGLQPIRLGSINPRSPFYRDISPSYF